MIIGLTGSLGAGKGTVAEILKEKGFIYLSLSDELRELAKERGVELTRENLQNLGNNLREHNGAGALAKLVHGKVTSRPNQNFVIDGIRNPAEIEVLKELKDFTLVAVDAPKEMRFSRLVERNREKDPKTFDEFLRIDSRDSGLGEASFGQAVGDCMKMAEVTIRNDGSLEQLRLDIDTLLNAKQPSQTVKTEKRKDYISWDDYFMGISLLSAKRSKDPSTQIGACIVNSEKRIVGTGYNGFPVGLSDEELPWSREGEYLETKYPYVCHAELNAVVNSIGRDLRGCVIYSALFPCNECAKVIIQSGIKEVVYLSDKYAEVDAYKASRVMLNMAGVKCRRLFPSSGEIKIDFNRV